MINIKRTHGAGGGLVSGVDCSKPLLADDVTRSVKIKVAKMPLIGTASDKDEE